MEATQTCPESWLQYQGQISLLVLYRSTPRTAWIYLWSVHLCADRLQSIAEKALPVIAPIKWSSWFLDSVEDFNLSTYNEILLFISDPLAIRPDTVQAIH